MLQFKEFIPSTIRNFKDHAEKIKNFQRSEKISENHPLSIMIALILAGVGQSLRKPGVALISSLAQTSGPDRKNSWMFCLVTSLFNLKKAWNNSLRYGGNTAP